VANGSNATITWLPAQSCHSPITGYTVTGQPGNLVMNLPATATSATFSGLQTGVTYTFTVTAANAAGSDTLTAQWRCSSVSESATPGSPQPYGTLVAFSASASGCPHPLYKFWVLAPGSHSWQVLQAYSSTATANWDTSGLATGNYLYTVWVRDSSSTAASCNSLGCFDAYAPATNYTLTTNNCSSVSESATPASPQFPGTTVVFTASASGCSHPLYQFWTLAPGSSTWQIAQPYSSAATFSWNTSGLAPGNYLYTVWVRDSGSAGTSSNSLGRFDAYFPATAYTLATQACASVNESAAPPSTAATGTTVTFTATASGCSHPLYQFWTLAPGSTTWQIVQPYSTAASFNWDTTGRAAGTYRYTVLVRDSSSAGTSSNSLGNFDAYFPATAYTLTTQPCSSVSESAAPGSPQASGTSVTFTASASGCPHPLYQFWILAPGSTTWTIAQPYSSTATFTWNTTGLPAGTYRYTVWVRDASSGGTGSNSLGRFDAYFPATAYTLT
jgi:hypothetical protein